MIFFNEKTRRLSLLTAVIAMSFGLLPKTAWAQQQQRQRREKSVGIAENKEISLPDNLPPQILLSKAWASFDLRRIGDAHLYANAAWKKSGQNLPEANYLIGLVHYANADYTLAQRYFNRALTEEPNPKSRVYFLYASAAIHVAEGKIDDYAAVMRSIMNEGLPASQQELLKNQRQQALKILFKSGLDRVLDLYRWPGRRDIFAAESLAMLMYQRSVLKEEGRLPKLERPLFELDPEPLPGHVYDKKQPGSNIRPDMAEAVELLLYALDSQVSTIINRMKYYRPDYTFTTLEKLFEDARSYREIREYIMQGGLYRTYYLLAVAMYRYNPDDTQYKVLLNKLRLIPQAGEWARRAQAQFDAPYTETYNLESTELINISRGQATDSLYTLF